MSQLPLADGSPVAPLPADDLHKKSKLKSPPLDPLGWERADSAIRVDFVDAVRPAALMDAVGPRAFWLGLEPHQRREIIRALAPAQIVAIFGGAVFWSGLLDSQKDDFESLNDLEREEN